METPLEHEGARVTSAQAPYLVEPPVSGTLADLPFVNAAEAPSAVVFSRREGAASKRVAPEGSPERAASRWRDVTAAEFAVQVTDVAKGLIEAGIEPGDRVAIMSRTRYEWTLLDFAVWAAGAVVVPVYPTASAEQAAWAIHDSGVRAVIAEDETCANVLEEVLGWSGVLLAPPQIWRLDQGAVEELMMRGGSIPSAELDRRRAAVTPSATATIVYTSGTTGMPKGVPLSHANFLAEAVNCVALLRPVLDRSPGGPPSTLLFLPLAHVLTRVIEVACVQARIRLGHSPSTKPADLRPDLESFGATFLAGVPYVFEKIHQLGRAEARERHLGFVYDRATRVAVRYGERMLRARAGDGPGPSLPLRAARLLYELLVYRRVRAALGGRIREAISGGSALSPRLMLFFAGAGILVYEGYGLTETTGPVTVNPPGRPRPGTVGPPLPGCSVRIADDGEVLLRGPQVFRGYQAGRGTGGGVARPGVSGAGVPGSGVSGPGVPGPGVPGSGVPGSGVAGEGLAGPGVSGAGAAGGSAGSRGAAGGALLADGWFATGDLGRLDADGYLTITGRKKDILITHGGKNVSPGPLEDQLRAHPVISQCIVIGDDRPYVAALVTLDRAQLVLAVLDDRAGRPAPTGGDSADDDTADGDFAISECASEMGGGVQVQSAIPVPPSVVAQVAAAVTEVNASVSQPESIRRVRIVEGDFTRERGLLSSSLKVRRRAVLDAYQADVEALYA
ncbi:MAG TPA: AMP-binding protein [Trebonia sp.]